MKRFKLLGLLVLLIAMLPMLPQSLSAATPANTSEDNPVVLNLKATLPSEEEEKLLARDDFFVSRRVAGDNPLSIEVAGQLRSVAARAAAALRKAPPPGPATFQGAWSGIGPNPIVQVSRSNHFTAESGRIGALVMRSTPPYTRILGAAQGGIWLWNPATSTWAPKTDNLPSLSIGALALAPSNENVVYAGTGEGALSGDSYFGNGVLKSSDGGNTWAQVSGDTFRGVSISRIVVHPTDPNRLWAAVLRGRGGSRRVTPPNPSVYGIWESTDGGVNWTLRKGSTNEFMGATDLEIDPQSPNILYASFWGDAIYKSSDYGVNWAPIMNGLPTNANYSASLTRFSIGLSHPAGQAAVLYAGFDYDDTSDTHHASRIWKSTNQGASWSILPAGTGADTVEDYCGEQCFYDNVIEVDPINPNIVYAAGQFNYAISSGGIFRSDDGGNTWLNLGYDQHPDFHAFAFRRDAPDNILIGSDGGVWFSSSRGGRTNPGDPLSAVTWENLNGTVNPDTAAVTGRTNLQITQFTSIANVPQIPNRVWGGTQDNGTLRKTGTSNLQWFDVASGDGGQVLVDQNDPNFVFGTYFGITPYRYTDGGLAFFSNASISKGINLSDRAEFYIPWTMNPGNPNQLFLGTYRLYRTNNAETPSAGDVTWQAISPDLTTGCTGTAPNGARGCFISAIGVSGGGPAVYTGSDDGVVSFSADAGASATPTWQRVDRPPLPHRPVTQIAVDRSNYRVAYFAYAGFNQATLGTPGHVFKTTDAGKTWQNISGNLPDAPVNSIILDPSYPNTLYVGTDVGPFVTYNGGGNWTALGTGFPVVTIWQLALDPANRNLRAGTHGRGAWTVTDGQTIPALTIRKSDAGIPVGPNSVLTYSLTVQNIGNVDATGVTITDPVPADTSFVSATSGGALNGSKVVWSGLTVPKGASVSVSVTVRIGATPKNPQRVVVNDGYSVTSVEGVGANGSPYVIKLAPAHAVSIAPSTQTDGTRPGQSLSYALTIKNLGFTADQYNLSVSGNTFPASFFDPTCTTALTQTPTVNPGVTTSVCVKVTVPANATNGTTDTATVQATSVADSSVSGTATIKTIAVTAQILLVDNDNNGPDVKSYYQAALTGQQYNFWDLSVSQDLPLNYMKAHKNIVWFTGASYPGPLLSYESKLAAFLDNGGRLFMSGWDILDQSAGTTSFVHDYLHINWDGTETQNDKATANVHGQSGNVVTNGIGAVPLDLSVLDGAQFSDQLTLISPAVTAFTDDSTATDGLSLDTGTYKVVFLAFPFEEYGTASEKADLMSRVLTYFGP
jgi:uncharacterized repeat protein (TIGR01451 family)